jgi:hypothetical protein
MASGGAAVAVVALADVGVTAWLRTETVVKAIAKKAVAKGTGRSFMMGRGAARGVELDAEVEFSRSSSRNAKALGHAKSKNNIDTPQAPAFPRVSLMTKVRANIIAIRSIIISCALGRGEMA